MYRALSLLSVICTHCFEISSAGCSVYGPNSNVFGSWAAHAATNEARSTAGFRMRRILGWLVGRANPCHCDSWMTGRVKNRFVDALHVLGSAIPRAANRGA